MAGKRGTKQLITVFADAPEDFKELKERRLAKGRIMTIKSSRRRRSGASLSPENKNKVTSMR